MNEAENGAEHIDPALKAAGCGVVEGSRIRREFAITLGHLAARELTMRSWSSARALVVSGPFALFCPPGECDGRVSGPRLGGWRLRIFYTLSTS